ncbi:F-type H+-transporting ATPase subunit a [Spinactinospora alkalitolerans]|uniref:ATP synthase subunit a n=1 Tax=Spinactinospora alkalitolerans TaxID=687207 RepID=A0A852TZV5_9ACTN|nr:F0F1 ATP synthase subunit A [Spinactinospora alkalitolerans]NYE49458.1 F-type H+-transporting ATPase subunit a [Spinactinospora alkalitolerans]
MSADVRTTLAAAGEGCQDPHIFNDYGCGFEAPTTSLFFPTPWLEFGLPATSGITKYTALLVLSVLLVAAFWFFTMRRAKVVPGRGQSIAELLITFVRDQMTRPGMGKKGDKYLPMMVAIFLFILVMNVMGIIPGAQLPVTSNLAFPAVLAISMYVLWNYIGIREHGFGGHVKGKLVPSGAPVWILPVLVPIEFISNFVFRPVTHAIRLFATMFAGHMLLAVFAAAGFYLFNPDAGGFLGVLSVGYSGFALLGFLVFTGFELFIMGLQAYVFVLLASFYIGEAIEGAH